MNIKAIETFYKGYRFRSRLEARWAVFFDQLGIKWQYEVEGFDLPSGRYLPDFYLQEQDCFVEIKPPHVRPVSATMSLPRVYMAGSMSEPCWRPFSVYGDYYVFDDSVLSPVTKTLGGRPISYTGPFRTGLDNHSPLHGLDCAAYCFETEVFKRSVAGIKMCNVFFAYFDDLEAYGTLVEVGMAHALGKRIIIGFSNKDDAYRWCPTNHGSDPQSGANDLWFAASCAEAVFGGPKEEIIAEFGNWLAIHYPVSREIVAAGELASGRKSSVCLFYGDPVEALVSPIWWRSYPLGNYPSFKVNAAALAARQARFGMDNQAPGLEGAAMDLPAFDQDFASPEQWAAMYRSLGLQAVPARMPIKGGEWKMPALASWAEFQENLIPQATVDRWYGTSGEHARRQNIGIITGRCSGNVFVIDLDDQKGPEAQAWWHGLLELHNSGIDPETVEQRTGGGGRQKLFRAPMDWVAPTNKTAIHIDIRGQGGFAMMPGSMHESGRCYEWLAGCAPWEVEIGIAPEWLLEAIDTLIVKHGSRPRTQHTPSPETRTNPFGTKIIEGREGYMRDMIWRVMLDWYRQCPIGPPPAIESTAKMEEAWAVYESCVGSRLPREPGVTNAELLERENRGHSLFANKWRRELKNWGNPKMAGEAKKRPPNAKPDFTEEFAKAQASPGAQPAATYELLSVRDIKAMADPLWLVDGLVVDQSMGFIYGPPGCLKTFLALGMALSLASGQKLWWNRGVQRAGAVVYISSEGQADLKFRIMAWEKHNKVSVDDCPFFLIRQSINFMDGGDVMKLLATVQAVAVMTPIAAVFVDTVSRVLPGAEENLQKDMSLFVAACDAVRQTFSCMVCGLHHTNKSGGMRGSTVIPGAGDFIIEMLREPGAMDGAIRAVKIKAAEDGWEQPFEVKKIDLPGIVQHTSLVLVPVQAQPQAARAAAGKGGMPDITVCREILSALALAWFQKVPWCKASNGQRPAVDMITGRWQLKRDVVKKLLADWMANGIIDIEVYDKRGKLSGYRKIIDL